MEKERGEGGKPRDRWVEVLKSDTKITEVSRKDASDRNKLKARKRVTDPT